MADLEELIDRASRMMAAGWRGNPNMSGDDRDFMPPSQRRRHDDRVRSVVEFVLSESAKQKGEAEGWRSDLDAMPHGEDFLAENRFGDWVIARRFDPLKSGDYSGNAVINKRTGRWWHPQRWRPLPEPPTMLSAGGEG